MAGDEGYGKITRLPEECISHAISLTSPIDSCRSAVVSTTFRSAVDSDSVWEHFLPSDYEEILSRAVDPVEFSSKKELYFRLSDSILVDGGKINFWLERSTGRKCYTLSARELHNIWGDTPCYRTWKRLADSRFPEVVELRNVWLEIKGSMDSKVLSRRTNYAAYLIFKLSRKLPVFRFQSASVSVGSNSSTNVVCLNLERMQTWSRNTPEGVDSNDVVRAPNARLDGWMEMELGEFFSGDGDDGNVEISLFDNGPWKNGFIVEGIEPFEEMSLSWSPHASWEKYIPKRGEVHTTIKNWFTQICRQSKKNVWSAVSGGEQPTTVSGTEQRHSGATEGTEQG